MEMTIKQTLTTNLNVRAMFAAWYYANVGDRDALAKWLNLHPRFQVTVMLEFLATQNIAVDIVETQFRSGYNIRILDTTKFPETEMRATNWLYEDVDGDIYIQRMNYEGTTLEKYVAAIVATIKHINILPTCEVEQTTTS